MPPLCFLPLMIGPLGMQEMLIILVVALIVFGPRKLPQIGKTLGKSIAEFRRTSTELRSTLEREVQMEEFREARSEVSGLGKEVADLGRGLDPAAGSAPAAAKAPEKTSSSAPGPAEKSKAGATESEESADGSVASATGAPGGEESAGAGEPGNGASGPKPESSKDPGPVRDG